MGSAIWSATTRSMTSMPARFFVRFFANHGMLTVNDRPLWRVIDGGSRRYLDRLVAGQRDRIFLGAAVQWIRRLADHVLVKVRGRDPERFDRVFLACHSDQALSLLADPSPLERGVLGAISYQSNEAVLHTDRSLMPRRRRAWAAWNYHVLERPDAPVAVTYNMNTLQGLDASEDLLVTLNHSEAVDPAKIIQRIEYTHPVFTANAVAAQARHRSINGVSGTYYSGAYWRFGFHEDGVVSALAALTHFREDRARAERHFQRAG
jgi:predicted NAD/FAD-binding protein